MKMFGNLTTENLEKPKDMLGRGGLLDSGVYTGTVKVAYVRQAESSKAQSVTVHILLGGTEFRETFWITNRNGENFFVDKLDPKKKRPIPGFAMINDLCLLTTGYGLPDQDVGKKVMKLYDYESRTETPQTVPVLTDVIGKKITVGLLRQIVDKRRKNETGEYVNTGETREEIISDKFFHSETRRTVTEVKEGLEEGVFLSKWLVENKGKTRNRAKGGEGSSGSPGAPAAAGRSGSAPAATQRPKTSLFGG